MKVGGWASHVVVDADDVAPVPDRVNGITAWQMLHRSARVRAGQTVLVPGASGGGGSVLAQPAVAAVATVIGTVSGRHPDALRELGPPGRLPRRKTSRNGSVSSRRAAWTRSSTTSAAAA